MQITDSQKNTGSNHAISALKFKIIKEFLDLGYSVLLSDIDIVWLDVRGLQTWLPACGLPELEQCLLRCHPALLKQLKRLGADHLPVP